MFTTICLPTLPQADTITAIFILKKFGGGVFPGVETARCEMVSKAEEGLSERDYLKQGKILIDLGGGIFDHHNKPKQTTATNLVIAALGLEKDKAFEKLIAYTERDDFYGKGTISNDPLDKAFGLSGLIAALKKAHPKDPTFIIECIIPLLDAHYARERMRTDELPKEFMALKEEGKFEECFVTQKKNKLKVCFIQSDNTQMPGFLRAVDGGRYDVVVQKRSSGHVNVITRSLKRVDLTELARMVRSEEYKLKHGAKKEDEAEFGNHARVEDVPNWYFDPATVSLQNGGMNPDQTEATLIPWSTMKEFVVKGLTTES
jgi:hypothetical protein